MFRSSLGSSRKHGRDLSRRWSSGFGGVLLEGALAALTEVEACDRRRRSLDMIASCSKSSQAEGGWNEEVRARAKLQIPFEAMT